MCMRAGIGQYMSIYECAVRVWVSEHTYWD